MNDSKRSADPAWAWAPYKPDTTRPWNLAWAGHLLRRAGFGPTWRELQQALEDGPEKTVARLIRPEDDLESFNREHDAYEAAASGSIESLRAWWLRRMNDTPEVLHEKMTLFWHDHFGTSASDPGMMHKHVMLLRHHALGRFSAMLQDVSQDPATLVSLGAVDNRKSQPSEHFARMFLERFSLGPDNFSDADVHAAARAFTGRRVLRSELRHFDREWDASVKTLLGEKGPLQCEDVVRIVLRQPACSRWIVRRLYTWLIAETAEPSDSLLEPLATSFATTHDIGPLVETMLRSNLFFSDTAYRQRVKCPVEFAVGIVRPLESTVSTVQLSRQLADMGQSLLSPPTVRGWAGGRHWINRATLIARENLARSLIFATGPYDGKLDPAAVADRHGQTDTSKRFFLDLFLQDDFDHGTSKDSRHWVHSICTLPEFHLS